MKYHRALLALERTYEAMRRVLELNLIKAELVAPTSSEESIELLGIGAPRSHSTVSTKKAIKL
jgi:hypothetical protein